MRVRVPSFRSARLRSASAARPALRFSTSTIVWRSFSWRRARSTCTCGASIRVRRSRSTRRCSRSRYGGQAIIGSTSIHRARRRPWRSEAAKARSMEKARHMSSALASGIASPIRAFATINTTRFHRPMRSTTGRATAIGARTIPSPPAMSRRTSSATPTSTIMEPGAWSRAMATSGCRPRWRATGHRITMDTGPGSSRGVGPGSTMHPGVSRLFTTVAGPTRASAGAGCPARSARDRSTRRRWSPLSAAIISGFRLVPASRRAASHGSRLPPAKFIGLPTASAATISPTST